MNRNKCPGMKTKGLSCWILLLPVAMAHADGDPRLEHSRAAANQLQSELGSRLVSAVSEGGPVAAIEVCSVEAPAIAASLSTQYDARVNRTAERVRNPANAPSPEQAVVLADMRKALAAGSATVPEHFEVRADGSALYMRAIPTQPQCLACHGEQIAPAVQAALAQRYPGDQATGFAVGDLRGAFVVEWPAPGATP